MMLFLALISLNPNINSPLEVLCFPSTNKEILTIASQALAFKVVLIMTSIAFIKCTFIVLGTNVRTALHCPKKELYNKAPIAP